MMSNLKKYREKLNLTQEELSDKLWFPKSKNGYLIFLNGDNVTHVYEQLLHTRFYLGKDLWNKR